MSVEMRELELARKLGVHRSKLKEIRDNGLQEWWRREKQAVIWVEAGLRELSEMFHVELIPEQADGDERVFDVSRANVINKKVVLAARGDSVETVRVVDNLIYRGKERDGARKKVRCKYDGGRWMEVKGPEYREYRRKAGLR